MYSDDITYFFEHGNHVEIAVPHMILERPFFYYGYIKRLTEEIVTLEQDQHKGIVDIPIKDIIHVKSKNWEVS